eukprot:TRINITY_DN12864_c0_g1_i4.p1 TRINITY_DN12864_c0_g1~~TRINITY_DN12864_c0_g1_i4.p1  ORF type:complete len:132 (-),score=21.65 TRINITY_DN12864_c0_g1_i4:113-508(-)
MGNNCTKPPPEPRAPAPVSSVAPNSQNAGRRSLNAPNRTPAQAAPQRNGGENRFQQHIRQGAPHQPGSMALMLPPGWEIRLAQDNRIYYVDHNTRTTSWQPCLLYTSDAADEEDSVDLGGRRIIKKKKKSR